MKVGHISKKSFKRGEESVSYLEMILRVPMMESATFTVASNKDKSKENAPDFNIFFSINRKGDSYPSALVGALWNRVSDSGVEYKSGYIETPAVTTGKMYIAVFATKVEEGVQKSYSHDVIWSAPQQRDESSYTENSYAQPSNSTPQTQKPQIAHEYIPQDEEIPF